MFLDQGVSEAQAPPPGSVGGGPWSLWPCAYRVRRSRECAPGSAFAGNFQEGQLPARSGEAWRPDLLAGAGKVGLLPS